MRAEGEHPHSRVPGLGVKGVYLPPMTGGPAGGTEGGRPPEDSEDAAAPEVLPAGDSVLEARSSILIILLTSESFILIVSNHNSVLSNIELELLFASMIAT